MSTGGWDQCEWSPCKEYTVSFQGTSSSPTQRTASAATSTRSTTLKTASWGQTGTVCGPPIQFSVPRSSLYYLPTNSVVVIVGLNAILLLILPYIRLITTLQGCVESSHGVDAPDRAQRDASASGLWSMHRFIKRHQRQCIELPGTALNYPVLFWFLSSRMSLFPRLNV